MQRYPDLCPEFFEEDAGPFNELRHRSCRVVCTGNYDEAFLAVVEDIAEFVLNRCIPISWVAGSIVDLFEQSQMALYVVRRQRENRFFVAALGCLPRILAPTLQFLDQAGTRASAQAADVSPATLSCRQP